MLAWDLFRLGGAEGLPWASSFPYYGPLSQMVGTLAPYVRSEGHP